MTPRGFNRVIRALSSALAVAALASGCSTETAKRAPDAVSTITPAVAVSLPSGTTLHAPLPGLITAGQPAPGDWKALQAQGVATVINLRPAAEMAGRDEASEVREAGMRYVELPIATAQAINHDAARTLDGLLRDAAPGAVLLHCASGNRVGGLLAVRALQQGKSLEEALAIGRAAGMQSSEARVRELVGSAD